MRKLHFPVTLINYATKVGQRNGVSKVPFSSASVQSTNLTPNNTEAAMQSKSLNQIHCDDPSLFGNMQLYNRSEASIPLIQNYSPRWPQIPISSDIDSVVTEQTIPEDAIRLKMTNIFDQGTATYYRHLKQNPADFKVTLWANIDKLNLKDEEKKILIEMVGPRYNFQTKEIRIICDRYANRIENKKYVIHLLENLVKESKNIFLHHQDTNDVN